MEFLIHTDGVFVLRLIVAMALGGLIGLERQSRGRPAGLRTNILVCLGSAAVISVFQKLYEADPGAGSAFRIDPARAAAGVIMGVGFLGAGTVVKSRNFVRGLTTAASIWVVAAVGITVGLGEYVVAVTTTFLVLLTLFVLHRVQIATDRFAPLVLEWTGGLALVDGIVSRFEAARIRVRSRSVSRQPKTGRCRATLVLRYRDETAIRAIVDELQQDERFDRVTWN